MNSTKPHGFPYSWCNCGEDNYGIWIEIKIANSETRMRWMKPGEFIMGSPNDHCSNCPVTTSLRLFFMS